MACPGKMGCEKVPGWVRRYSTRREAPGGPPGRSLREKGGPRSVRLTDQPPETGFSRGDVIRERGDAFAAGQEAIGAQRLHDPLQPRLQKRRAKGRVVFSGEGRPRPV